MSAGRQDQRPSVAYLSYSTAEFDARTLRMARAATAAGWRARIYARTGPGLPRFEDLDGIELVRVAADWRMALPGLRWWARRRDRAQAPVPPSTARVPGALEAEDREDDGDEDEGLPTPSRAAWAGSLKRRAISSSALPLRWLRNLLRFPLVPMGWAVALDDQVEPADLWHGMWIGSLPALDRQRRRLGGRTVYDSRDIYMLARDRQALERPVRALMSWLERRLAQRADLILTVNEPYADLLARELRVARPTVVMNCSEVLVEQPARTDLIRAALGLDPSLAIVLYQGQLVRERGIEQAMEAILEIPGAILVLMGFGPLEAELRAKSAEAPYRDKVHVLSAVPPDDLVGWVASADVSVIPIQPTTINHRFSTPQKLFESLAAGIPVVASDLPGMAAIISSEGLGELCDPTSPEAIAGAIRTILEAAPEEREALRERVRAAAHRRYNWPSQARVLLEHYALLLGGGSPGGSPVTEASPRLEGAVPASDEPAPPGPGPRGSTRASLLAELRAIGRRLGLGRVRRALAASVADGLRHAVRHPVSSLRRGFSAMTSSHARLRERALRADRHGQPTLGLRLWSRLASDGNPEARRRARLDDGILRETDPSWLPTIAGPAETLDGLERRRILHLVKSSVPERWSGYTIRTLANVRAQQAVGLEPIVVTEIGWPRVAGISDIEPRVEVDGVAHLRLDRGAGYDPRALPHDVELDDLAEDLAPVIRDLRPSLIQAHSGHRGGELALVALALRERFRIPVVYEVRGLFEAVWSTTDLDVEESELFRRRLAQETRILREVDGILAISEALIDAFADRGIMRSRMSLLPNGIDPAAFDPSERDPELRRRLGLEGRFVAGYVGNLDHRREGIDVLVHALAELRHRGRRDIAVLIVGDGETRAGLEGLARHLGVDDACRFTGRVPHDEVARYYAQIDLFANPRLDEWASRYITPLKPFEAMALGLPVLVSDLPALREIVDPPNRGLTAPPGDPARLADAIVRLQDEPTLRSRIARAGFEWVRRERTWASNGPRYRAAYEAILGPIP